MLDEIRQDLDTTVRAELQRLELAFGNRLKAIERSIANAREETDRLRAETKRLRADPVHNLVDELRAKVARLQ